MKLKYYMRGLGIGIILTTLIFTITKTEEKLTDKEIMQRARVLGMVTEDERNSGLEQVLHNNEPTGTEEEPSENPEEDPSLTPTEAPSLAPTETPTASVAPTPTVGLTPESTPEPTPSPEPTSEPTISPTVKPEEIVITNEISFAIESGMTSGEVAALLAEVGLIEDAKAFNRYIVYQGKESIIRVGSYTLPQYASYDDIIVEITGE